MSMACQSSCHHIRHKITLCYASNPKPCTFTCITTKNVWIDIQSENKYCLRLKDLPTMHHLRTVVFKNGFDFFLLHCFAYPRVSSSFEGHGSISQGHFLSHGSISQGHFWAMDQFHKVIFCLHHWNWVCKDGSITLLRDAKEWRSWLEASFTKVN